MTLHVFELTIVLLITFLTRSAFRLLVCRRIRGSDTLAHLKMGRLVKDFGWRNTSRNFKPDYPLGYHKLLSILPNSWMERLEVVNGGVFDCFHVLLFVAVLLHFGGKNLPTDLIWFWGPLLVALHPAWTHSGCGPRAYYGTERVFSELLVAAVMCSLWQFTLGGSYAFLWYFAATILGGVTLNVSKFSAQVLLGFSVLLAIIDRNWAFLVFPILAFCIALLISSGTYWNVLRGQYKHLRWYSGQRDIWAVQRNSLNMLRRLVREKGWRRGLIAYLLVHSSWSVSLLGNAPLVLVLLLAGAGIGHMPRNPFAWEWLAVGTILWLATSLRPLAFLGEPERYLLGAVVPSYFMIVSWLPFGPGSMRWILLLYSVSWFLLQQFTLWRLSLEDEPESAAISDERELVEFLRQPPYRRLLTFGSSWFHFQIAYSTHPQPHWLFDSRVNTEFTWNQLFYSYPYPSWEAVRLLDIDLIVTEKSSFREFSRQSGSGIFPVNSLKKLLENEHYAVYEVDKLQAGARMVSSNTCTLSTE